ncbi:MAG TPA: hypothetical protein VIM19_09590 [Actinomycetes bacterium]
MLEVPALPLQLAVLVHLLDHAVLPDLGGEIALVELQQSLLDEL